MQRRIGLLLMCAVWAGAMALLVVLCGCAPRPVVPERGNGLAVEFAALDVNEVLDALVLGASTFDDCNDLFTKAAYSRSVMTGQNEEVTVIVFTPESNEDSRNVVVVFDTATRTVLDWVAFLPVREALAEAPTLLKIRESAGERQ